MACRLQRNPDMAKTKKRGKKLALKRETLRKLDNRQLGGVAGGYVARTTYCAGGTAQAGQSDGGTDPYVYNGAYQYEYKG